MSSEEPVEADHDTGASMTAVRRGGKLEGARLDRAETVGAEPEGARRQDDSIAVEEPLEIRIGGRALGVTMRTPGNDEELAAGLLLAEGIVRSLDDIGSIIVCRDADASELRNVVNVRLS